MTPPTQSQPGAGRRVAILLNSLAPYTDQLFAALAKRRIDLHVIGCARQERNRTWANSLAPSYPYHVLKGYTVALTASRYAYLNPGVSRLLDRLSPDCLVLTGIYPTMLMAAAWARRRGVKLALMTDGWERTMPNSVYHRIARPWVIARCQSVLVSGKKGAAYFERHGVPPASIFTAPLIPAWSAPSLLSSADERPFDLLWCGHINEEIKNISFFLDVALRLRAARGKLTVRVVGDGPLREKVLNTLSRADIVYKHTSNIPWRDMASVYLGSRLLLFPSKWEAWGMVCNEAMQCGAVCMVSPHVGAADDLVLPRDNGEVLPLDPALWATRAAAILDDTPRWMAYSERGRAAVGARSMQSAADEYQRMLTHLAAAS